LTAGAAQAADRYKIYLSMSYIGNDWQDEAAKMVKALAASADYKDKVDLKVQVAGPDAQKQIQQINAMVAAGAKAIVVYPISPTALNEAVCGAHLSLIAGSVAPEHGGILTPNILQYYSITEKRLAVSDGDQNNGDYQSDWLQRIRNGFGQGVRPRLKCFLRRHADLPLPAFV
jgi:ribose transport system substrate-binding protein